MVSPWFQFKPSNVSAASDVRLCMTFPSLVERRYSIIRDGEQQFILSEDAGGGGAIGVFVEVGQNSKVTLKMAADRNVPVKINGQDVDKEAELETGSVVQLGEHSYTFCSLPSEISNLRQLIQEIVPCKMCNRPCKDPRLLRCGHSFCAICLDDKIRNALSSTPNGDLQLQLPAGVAAAAERDEILQQIRTITCVACATKFSCWEAAKAYKPVVLNQVLQSMSTWTTESQFNTGPKCSVCSDSRCIVGVQDYEFCETCNRILCPVCAVEGHRDHNLRPREAIVKAMHEYGKVIAAKKMQVGNLRKQETALGAKIRSNMEAVTGLTTRMKALMSESYTKCSSMVSQFEAQATPLADTSAETFSRFSAQIEESTKQIMQISAAADLLTKAVEEMNAPPQEAPKSQNFLS